MATATKLDLSEQQLEEVNRLAAEFDPEQYIPQEMKERGASDLEGYLRMQRYELRGELEVAVLLSRALKQMDRELRLQIFYAVAEETVRVTAEVKGAYEAAARFGGHFSREKADGLGNTIHETGEIAIQRALFYDEPQLVS